MEVAYGQPIKSNADLEKDRKIDMDLDTKLKIIGANVDGYTQGLKESSKTNTISCEGEKTKDAINPDHYKNQTSLECIEAMQIAFGREAVLHFCLCNAFKYIWRWKNKNGMEDLDKAQWYVERAFDILNDNETSPVLSTKFQKSLVEINLYLTKYMEGNE